MFDSRLSPLIFSNTSLSASLGGVGVVGGVEVVVTIDGESRSLTGTVDISRLRIVASFPSGLKDFSVIGPPN